MVKSDKNSTIIFIITNTYDCHTLSHYTQKFADENGMAFFEVSAKDGTNVELAMTDMVARIWRTIIAESSTDD